MIVSFNALHRQYATLKDEIATASDKVLSTGQVLDGWYTKEFERRIALKCNRKYAISVNSGTQALVFAQQALNVHGDVLIPTISFVATLNSVLLSGNTPIYSDVDITGMMTTRSYEHVSAIMYVNLFGNTLDYHALRAANPGVPIIEDAAQSFGASFYNTPSGKLGDISVLSFDPTKNLPNYGSGGMVLTDDGAVAQRLKAIRNNGKVGGQWLSVGTNSKMSEVDCAHMIVKLGHFDAWQTRRKDIADYYTNNIKMNVFPLLPDENITHAWHKYVIRTEKRDDLCNWLFHNEIETKIHYDQALYDYTASPYKPAHSTITELHKANSLSLPIYPELTDYEVEYVVKKLNSFYS